MKKFITRTIIIVSVVSLLTDIASEMLYPVMPLYLRSIGYGVLAIGLIEGIAELVAGINKVFFARLSDASGKRKIFIIIGYSISAITKPAIGLTQSVYAILTAKLFDRFGKGIRTAPRDALLVQESTPENRGKVFGFHRSIDTLGAVIGPIIGLCLLFAYPGHYRLVFLVSFFPGVLAILATLYLPKEKKAENSEDNKKPVARQTIKGLFAFWGQSSPEYKKLFLGFTLFSLVNSSNMFLLLRASQLGFTDMVVLAVYLVFNIVYALTSYPLGRASDKIGFQPIYILGLLAFVITYAALGFGPHSLPVLVGLFALYGVFAATEDGIAKAWLSLHIPKEYKATGLGLFMMASSFGFLVASTMTALMWDRLGSPLVLSAIALVAVLLCVYFAIIKVPTKQTL